MSIELFQNIRRPKHRANVGSLGRRIFLPKQTTPNIVTTNHGYLIMKDLAPTIYRQRLVIEGYPDAPVTSAQIKDYLTKLSDVLEMKTLIEPVTHRSDVYGWAGWIHWETSGAHFYAWDKPTLFFSVDIYTCKKFDPKTAESFTKDYFKATQLESKGF